MWPSTKQFWIFYRLLCLKSCRMPGTNAGALSAIIEREKNCHMYSRHLTRAHQTTNRSFWEQGAPSWVLNCLRINESYRYTTCQLNCIDRLYHIPRLAKTRPSSTCLGQIKLLVSHLISNKGPHVWAWVRRGNGGLHLQLHDA